MFHEDDYSSDTSDEDFVPLGVEEDHSQSSESSGAEESDGDDLQAVLSPNAKKQRLKSLNSNISKNQKDKFAKEDESISKSSIIKDEKHIESLWASFKESPSSVIQQKPSVGLVTSSTVNSTPDLNSPRVKTETSTTSAQSLNIASPGPNIGMKRPGQTKSGGLVNLASRLSGKKPKLSTLEKSKLDWDNFKKNEGIEEDLKTFNQGKMGYVERQAFLERTDFKQFEIEKNLRTSRKQQP